MSKTKVVFVGGYGRSGSTIIDLLLDRVPGIVAVGEFRHLFGRALGDNELCSCGNKFLDCPFWGEVITEAFPDGYDRAAIQHAVKRFNRLFMAPLIRHLWLMTPSLRKDAKIYREAFAAGYRAVGKVSGANVVIDSTKYPMHGWFLSTMPELDLKTMLLVRDPRAVAFSWQRRRLRPEIHWEEREMPRHHPFMSGGAWTLFNYFTAHMRSFGRPYRVQRYEDFVADPPGELAAIASFALGKDVKLAEDLFDKQPRVPHTIAGNPVRIGSEHVKVRADDEWMGMPLYDQIFTAICSFPGMLRYRYPFRIKK